MARSYLRSLRQSRAGTKLYAFGLLGTAALLLCTGAESKQTRHLEKTLEQRIATKRQPKAEWYELIWERRAARVNAALGLVLGLCWPLVDRRLQPSSAATPPERSHRQDLMRCGLFAGTCILAVSAFNAPRLHHGLWNDEESSVRRFIIGHVVREDDGRFEFIRVPWVDTVFDYHSPNNHVLFSILAKAAHSFAPAPTGPQEGYFSEPWLRLPSFLAGMAALGLVAALGIAMSRPRLGMAAMLFFALHPWFSRYTTEARAYGLLFALGPLQWLAAVKGAATGRWRWWVLLALAVFLSLWAWPMTVYLCAAGNTAALALIAVSPQPHRDKLTLLGRWFLCQCFALMAFVQVFMPDLVQLTQFMRTPDAKGMPLGPSCWWDTICGFFTGSPWYDECPDNPLSHCWSRVFAAHHAALVAGGTFLAALFVLGVVHAWRGGKTTRCLLLAWLLPVVLTALHARLTGSVMFDWYFSPTLPGLAFVLAAGAASLADLLATTHPARTGLLLVSCTTFALITQPRRQLLRDHPVDPIREAALTARQVINPWHPGFVSQAMVGAFVMQLDPYTPGMVVINSPDELDRLTTQADALSRDLFIIVGTHSEAQILGPQIMAELDDPRRWTRILTLWGTEGASGRVIYKARH